jgi:predicted transcriptional regulator
MPTSVLLSIKPEFANAILDGTKTFELRRSIFRSATVRKIVIYASSPVSCVVGEFIVGGILALEPQQLWEVTANGAGISREFFEEYFDGCDIGYALKVSRPLRYHEPSTLKDLFGFSRPPQSFRYLPELTIL